MNGWTCQKCGAYNDSKRLSCYLCRHERLKELYKQKCSICGETILSHDDNEGAVVSHFDCLYNSPGVKKARAAQKRKTNGN